MKIRIMIMATIIALLVATLGLVQGAQGVRVNIPFQFTVGNKVLPAGQYDFTQDALGQAILVRSVKGGPSSDALVITRLGGAIHNSPQDSHVVFDKVGDACTFSELWMPEMDGFLVNATKGKHEHQAVNVAR